MNKNILSCCVVGIIIGSLLSFCGCDQIGRKLSFKKRSSKKDMKTEKPSYIQDVSLAEAIIRTPPAEITFARDPFRPLFKDMHTFMGTGGDPEAAGTLTLMGIYGGDAPVALIKGPDETYVVQEQGYAEGFLVKKIMEDRVLLEKDKEIITLIIGGQKE
ncbi:MAG: hypothetical protein JXD21_04875 [Candidatus Omnitrophica bacterium]|nr:hypothetical protein [Candidatus Omnitrophota bacterium]